MIGKKPYIYIYIYSIFAVFELFPDMYIYKFDHIWYMFYTVYDEYTAEVDHSEVSG